jgi:hypothetical protein
VYFSAYSGRVGWGASCVGGSFTGAGGLAGRGGGLVLSNLVTRLWVGAGGGGAEFMVRECSGCGGLGPWKVVWSI